jgi:hypothetical protein
MEDRYCATCHAETPVVRPECADGHELDCPDAFCGDCGSAFFVGIIVITGEAATGRAIAAA